MTRSLRVGIVLGGRLVEERIFDGTTPITLGQSLRCTLSVPADGVPHDHVLFAPGFVLRLTPAMACRLGDGGRLDGETPLARGARGKLTIGDATILFQEIATPPVRPRPRLPASVRGTFADRIDRRLALIIGGSLVVHVAIAAWAWSSDIDLATLGEPQLAATFHEDTIDVTLPDLQPRQPGVATPVSPTQTPTPIVRPVHVTVTPTPTRDDALRMATTLTDDGDHEHGHAGMTGRQPGADLGRQIADARDHVITIGDGGRSSRDRVRIGTGPDRPLVDDPTYTPPTARPERDKGRITLGPVQPDTDTTLTAAVVLDKIQNVYMSGLQRCYRQGLAVDGSLVGRVSIGFTVDGHGRVAEPAAAGVNPQVDGCVASLMAGWHFPAPRDQGGEPTDASFHVSLALQPS